MHVKLMDQQNKKRKQMKHTAMPLPKLIIIDN